MNMDIYDLSRYLVARLGQDTDAPAPVGSDETTTSRTIIALLKALKNLLRALNVNQGAPGATAWPVSISQGTPGTSNLVESKPSCRRNAGALHRSGITAVDKVPDLANTDLSTADNGAGTGSLNQSTTYYVTAIPRNALGTCKVAATINTQITGAYGANTGSIRLTIPQRTGATHYGIYLSTDAAPKWVGSITEAQRAAGDYEITAVGVVSAGGGNPPGTVDINVAGTQIQTSHPIFALNTAYITAGITPINCAGYSRAHVLVELTLADLRSAPACAILPFLLNQLSTHYCAGEYISLGVSGPLSASGSTLMQDFYLDVDGATGLIVAIGALSGQTATVSIWVELA
jgi:hypothetical protein